MDTPHPQLIPLLQKHDISWEIFRKRGRPPKGVRAKRAAIVTELHQVGTTWAKMQEITGLSNGAIQRLTGAMWNQNSRKILRKNMREIGSSWKGKHRPGQLEAQWESGTFDFHRGRVRSTEEREKLKAGWTPELRLQAGVHSRGLWGTPEIRDKLLDFHRSPEERARRSQDQTRRMAENPGMYLRGKAQWVDTPKGLKPQAYVRSSYEAAAVVLLEADTRAIQYEHEPRMICPDGRWVLPDFLVEYQDGSTVLIEVKADWVFTLPRSHKVRKRLQLAESLAETHGWGFAVWTEKELKDALRSAA